MMTGFITDGSALLLSLKLAGVTTFVILVLGLPLAFFLAQNPGRLSSLIEVVLSLPMVLPPVVLGFYLLLLLGPLHLAFTFSGLVIASVLYSFPFALQPFLAAFQLMDKNLIETSWSLGASKSFTFLWVVLPGSRAAVLSGALLAFAHTLGEFGVVLMIGGNIPGVSRTLSVSVYEQVQAMNYPSAHMTSAFLLLTSLIAMFAAGFLKKNIRKQTI